MTYQEPDSELPNKLLALVKREAELERELAEVKAKIAGIKHRLLAPYPAGVFEYPVQSTGPYAIAADNPTSWTSP